MAGFRPGSLLVDGFVVEGLGVLNLGVRGLYTRSGGNCHQIGVADSKHDQLTRVFVAVLRRFQAFGSGAFLFEVLEVEERLAHGGARIEIVEGPDHAGNWKGKNIALEAQGSEALGLYVFLHPGREVGQKVAEFFPSLAARHDGLITGEQQAEVVAESAIDGLLEIQLQNFRGGFALGLAAGEGTLGSRQRDGRRRRGTLRRKAGADGKQHQCEKKQSAARMR